MRTYIELSAVMPEKIPFSWYSFTQCFPCVYYCVYEAAAFGYHIFVFRFIFQFFTWTSPHYARLMVVIFALLCNMHMYTPNTNECSLVLSVLRILLLSCILVVFLIYLLTRAMFANNIYKWAKIWERFEAPWQILCCVVSSPYIMKWVVLLWYRNIYLIS